MAQQLEDLVGSLLVIGFPGTKVTPETDVMLAATAKVGIVETKNEIIARTTRRKAIDATDH